MIEKLETAFGAKVFDAGSMAEMTPWMNAAGTLESAPGMLLWQDMVYTEVCDPATFRRVPYGSRGTPVYTHLERTSQPMIRLVSGDLTRIVVVGAAGGLAYLAMLVPRNPLVPWVVEQVRPARQA